MSYMFKLRHMLALTMMDRHPERWERHDDGTYQWLGEGEGPYDPEIVDQFRHEHPEHARLVEEAYAAEHGFGDSARAEVLKAELERFEAAIPEMSR
jgi:hypothetical protein